MLSQPRNSSLVDALESREPRAKNRTKLDQLRANRLDLDSSSRGRGCVAGLYDGVWLASRRDDRPIQLGLGIGKNLFLEAANGMMNFLIAENTFAKTSVPCWSARGFFPSKSRRRALTTLDVLVSTVLLSVVMSTATSLCFRIQQVWKGIAHQRVATQELANHLEVITRLKPKDVDTALRNLQPSKLCCNRLLNPRLTGKRSDDELGTCISLELQWDGIPSPIKAHLSGWLIDAATAQPKVQSSNTNEQERP